MTASLAHMTPTVPSKDPAAQGAVQTTTVPALPTEPAFVIGVVDEDFKQEGKLGETSTLETL